MKVILQSIRKNDGWSGTSRYKNCNDNLGPYFTRSGSVYTGLEGFDKSEIEKFEGTVGASLHPTSPFWTTFRVRIGDKPLVLDTEDPLDEFKYFFLRNHKRVAKSLNEMKPAAYYVLVNEEAEATQRNKFNKIRRRAMSYFDKMSTQEVVKCLRVFGYSANNTQPEIAENKLNDLVERDPQQFITKWIDNDVKETEYLIKEAVAKNILRRTKNVYRYGTDVVGNSLQDTIDYLNKSSNSDIKLAIMKEIDAKV